MRWGRRFPLVTLTYSLQVKSIDPWLITSYNAWEIFGFDKKDWKCSCGSSFYSAFTNFTIHFYDGQSSVSTVSGIGAVVKVLDSHLGGWGSIPSKSCSFLCYDQHVKYWICRGFPLTSSLLLDYHIGNLWTICYSKLLPSRLTPVRLYVTAKGVLVADFQV